MVHKHLVKWLSEIIKKKENEVPHMLAPKRRHLHYSKIYCDVAERWLLAWNQNKHITYFICWFRNQYWTSLHSPQLSLIWRIRLHHCATLARNLITSILVRTPVSKLTFYILVPSWNYVFRTLQIPVPFHFHTALLTRLHGRSCPTISKILISSLKKRHLFFIYGKEEFSQIGLLSLWKFVQGPSNSYLV